MGSRTNAGSLRRLLDTLLLVAFVAALAMPAAVMTMGPRGGDVAVTGEKLAPLPSLPRGGRAWAELPGGLRAWFRDRFGLRQLLIHWNAKLQVHALGVTSSPQVVLGRDRWLYYAGERNVEDYRAVDPFSASDLEKYRVAIEHWHAFLDARGIPLVLVVAPNKSTVYPEHLPAWMTRVGPETRTDQLVRHLRERSGIEVLDLRPWVIEAKTWGPPLFFRTDTHWNALGAFAGYRGLATRLATIFPRVRVPEAAEYELRIHPAPGGDMARFLALPELDDEAVSLVPATPAPDRGAGAEAQAKLQDMRYVSRGATDRAGAPIVRALIFHDSFAGALMPYLGDLFGHAEYRWSRKFDYDLVEREHPEVVVFEVVERALMAWTPDPPPEQPAGASAAR